MKATGVVRRIDDLGRIVLPKELRRTMRIKEGESLEIYTDGDNKIVLKKYSPVNQMTDFVKVADPEMIKIIEKNEGIINGGDYSSYSTDSLTHLLISKNLSNPDNFISCSFENSPLFSSTATSLAVVKLPTSTCEAW